MPFIFNVTRTCQIDRPFTPPQDLSRGCRDPEVVSFSGFRVVSVSFSGFRVAEVDGLGVALAGLLDVEVRHVRGTVEETDNFAGIGDRPSRDNPQVSVLGQ